MSTPGSKLRKLREQLGLTIRDVEAASSRIAARHQQDDFAIPLSRLSEIETKGLSPSIYRLYSLSVIYRRDLRELLQWYGVDVNAAAADLAAVAPPRSHTSNVLSTATEVKIPVALDPAFDARTTSNLGRMIQRWGLVPVHFIADLAESDRFTYGYIGTSDFTMYPLLLPGSFVQIDETRNKVQEGVWRSEYERPIYFIETRDGFVCCWCSVCGDDLVLQPHPLSPVAPRTLKQAQDADIIGQVVGFAMRLAEIPESANAATRLVRQALN